MRGFAEDRKSLASIVFDLAITPNYYDINRVIELIFTKECDVIYIVALGREYFYEHMGASII